MIPLRGRSATRSADVTLTEGSSRRKKNPGAKRHLVHPLKPRYDRLDMDQTQPKVAVVMGSRSDWPTMSQAVAVLEELGVAHEARVVSAHRTPERMREFALSAEDRGLAVIIAGAGGAAHLPGMIAAMTAVPVLGVPVQSKALSGWDSLLSIAQMPGGVPVGTLAIGEAGAKNAGLLAAAILATTDPDLRRRLKDYRQRQTDGVPDDPRADAPEGPPR